MGLNLGFVGLAGLLLRNLVHATAVRLHGT